MRRSKKIKRMWRRSRKRKRVRRRRTRTRTRSKWRGRRRKRKRRSKISGKLRKKLVKKKISSEHTIGSSTQKSEDDGRNQVLGEAKEKGKDAIESYCDQKNDLPATAIR